MNTSSDFFHSAVVKIPGGVNSPVRRFKHVRMDPIYFAKASGPHLYSVEGKQYVDFCLSFGPHLLGHSHPKIIQAIQRQAEWGTSFGACHPGELEMADLLLKAYPFLDQVRLVNSGTEAVMTAIRIARGYSGKNKILKFAGCYHGHSDGLLAKAGSGVAGLSESSSKGVPPSIVSETLIADITSLGAIETLLKQNSGNVAAVILEPIPANDGLWIPTRAHLEEICLLARKHGALIIFDEVITGFRVAWGGVCGVFDLKPDLVTLGKIIGGGLPLAAVVGKQKLMECLAPVGEVYQAGTLSGNPISIAAGVAALSEIQKLSPYTNLEKQTEWFVKGLSEVLLPLEPFSITTFASMFWVHFDTGTNVFPPTITQGAHDKYVRLFKASLDAGGYLPPSPYEVGFLSTAHKEKNLLEFLEKLRLCL